MQGSEPTELADAKLDVKMCRLVITSQVIAASIGWLLATATLLDNTWLYIVGVLGVIWAPVCSGGLVSATGLMCIGLDYVGLLVSYTAWFGPSSDKFAILDWWRFVPVLLFLRPFIVVAGVSLIWIYARFRHKTFVTTH